MDNIKEVNEKYYIDKMSDYLVKNEKEKKSLISQIENLKTSQIHLKNQLKSLKKKIHDLKSENENTEKK